MGRLNGYLVYLLIPAIPYLLMIYSPETIDPIFQYLAHGTGSRYVLTAFILVFNWSIYFGIAFDARKENVRESAITLTKWYLFLIAGITSFCLLVFDSLSVQDIFLGNTGLIVVFYVVLVSFGKKNTYQENKQGQ